MGSYTFSSSTKRPSTVDIGGILFIFSDRNMPICSPDGENFYRVQQPYPLTDGWNRVSPTAAVNSSGNLTGDYSYYYAYYNKELGCHGRPSKSSEVSSVIKPLTTSANDVSVTAIEGVDDFDTHFHGDYYQALDDNTYTISIFRNVAGAAVVGGERPYYYRVADAAYTASSYSDNISDGSLDFTKIVPYGALPCPAFRYATIYNGRIVGAGFEPYESVGAVVFNNALNDEFVTAESISLGSNESFVFLPVTDATGSYVRPIPDIFNFLTQNIEMVLTSDPNMYGKRYEIIPLDYVFESTAQGDYYVIKLTNSSDGNDAAKDGSYSYRLVQNPANCFWYSQSINSIDKGYYYWGSPVYDSFNYEGYRLFPGDSVKGCASIGGCLLICGSNSTSIHIDISDNDEIPNYLQATIPGGIVSHWSLVAADGRLYALSSNGPQVYEPPTKEQFQGGYFGRWIPADGEAGHRKLQALSALIDLDDYEYCSGIYNPSANTIEWSWSTTDRTAGTHANQQVVYDLNTQGWYPISGRYKNCYDIGYEDGKAVTLHGDPYGCVFQDHTEDIDGGDDNMYSGLTLADNFWILPSTSASSGITTPYYQEGAGSGYRYTVSSSNLEWDSNRDIIGLRVYAVTYASNKWVINTSSYQTVIDSSTSGSNRYIFTDGSSDIRYSYSGSYYFALGIVPGYVDSPAFEGDEKGVIVKEFAVRMNPISNPQYSRVYGTSYSNEYVDVESIPAEFSQPDTSESSYLVGRFKPANAKGGSTTVRIGSKTASLTAEIKEIVVQGNTLNNE